MNLPKPIMPIFWRPKPKHERNCKLKVNLPEQKQKQKRKLTLIQKRRLSPSLHILNNNWENNMKRSTIVLFVLVIVGPLVAPFAASAQTAPPGGSPPAGGPAYCNTAAYAIPQPRIGGSQSPTLSPTLPATVQASDINRTTTAIAAEVWQVIEKVDNGHWRIEFVGYTTTPAMMGICATPSGDIPDIIFDEDAPNLAAAGPSFYADCQRVFNQLNRELDDYGFGALVVMGGCVVFLYYGAKATCLTFGPAVQAWLKGQAEFYYNQQSPIPGAAFESAWHQFSIALSGFCTAANIAWNTTGATYA